LLADGISRPLVPVSRTQSLLRCPDLHPADMEGIKTVGIGDVAVQRNGIELGEHCHVKDAGINAIADRDVDQTIFARQRNCRLGARFCQREQARSLPAPQNDR